MRLGKAVTAVAIAAAAVALSAGSATAAALITSANIKDQTIQSWDVAAGGVGTSEVRNGTVRPWDLHADTKTALKGDPGEPGADGTDGTDGVTNLEADGPYPGVLDLGSLPGQGDNSNEKVPADAAKHTVWVQCAPGKVALGGGFRLAADSGSQAAEESINVIASEPTQVKDGVVALEPIPGDAADSILPNGWLVEVVNNGDTEQVVRPWVVCADAG